MACSPQGMLRAIRLVIWSATVFASSSSFGKAERRILVPARSGTRAAWRGGAGCFDDRVGGLEDGRGGTVSSAPV